MRVKRLTLSFAVLLLASVCVEACRSTGTPLPTATATRPFTPSRTPTPTPIPLLHPGWTSYTNANYVADLAIDHEGNLWAVGSGGVVRWDPTDGTYTKYTVDDGLASNNVHAVAVAPDGALWFGTTGGVSRFDGQAPSYRAWTTYTIDDGLASASVEAIGVTPDGALWFGGAGGVSRFDGETWTSYTEDDGLVEGWVRSVAIAPDGAVWFGAWRGRVFCFREGEWTLHTVAVDEDLDDVAIDAIAVAQDGALWVSTSSLAFGYGRGVSRLDGSGDLDSNGETWTTYTKHDGLLDDSVVSIGVAPDGALWFGTADGVSRFDGDTTSDEAWTNYFTGRGPAGKEIRSIVAGPGGALWFGTWGGGILCFDAPSEFDGVGGRISEEAWTTYVTEDGLVHNDVRAVAVGYDGALWFGTSGGVSRFDGVTWTSYTSRDGLADNSVTSVAVGPDGALWFGTGGYLSNRGVSRFDGQAAPDEAWTTYTSHDGLIGNAVYAIARAPDGVMWFGTRSGVSRFDGETWKSYTPDSGLAGWAVESVAVAPDGTLWVGALSSGVSRFDGETWTTYAKEDGLAHDRVNGIAVSPDGGVWFATGGYWGEGGVSRFDGRAWDTYTLDDGLASDYVDAIAMTADGALWFGTAGGVSRFDGEVWNQYTSADGLASDGVRSIAVAYDGSLWFATGGGVSQYVPPDAVPIPTPTPTPTPTPLPPTPTPTPVVHTPTPTPTPWPKSRADWTSYTNVNQIADLAFDRDGNLWAATGGGVVHWEVGDGSYTRYGVEHGLADHRVTSVAVAPDGALWFGTWDGISRFDGENWTSYTYSDTPLAGIVESIAVDPDGIVWAGSLRSGVYRFDSSPDLAEGDEAWTLYTAEDGLVSNDVRAITVAPDGALWFGTCALWGPAGPEPPPCFGVSRYDSSADPAAGGQEWLTYSEEDGLAFNRVNDIGVGPDGALWFGTGPMGYTLEGVPVDSDTSGGVSRFDGETWLTFTRDDGLAANWVNGIATAQDGALWFATDGGVSRFDGVAWTTYTAEDGLVSDAVTAVAVAPDGALWFGTSNGISRFDISAEPAAGGQVTSEAAWTTYQIDGPADNVVGAVAFAPDGTLWVGTGDYMPGPSGRGVSHFDGVAWTTYTTKDGLADNTVMAIAVEPDGAAWFATGDAYYEGWGVSRFDSSAELTGSGAAWTTYTVDDGLGTDGVTSIAVALDGAVWFGGWGGAVSRFDRQAASDGAWTTYSSGVSVAAAPDGTVWAGKSGDGISRFDGETWTTYGTRDGLADGQVQAIAVAPDGTVWAGAQGGVSRFDGRSWTTFTPDDGLADDYIWAVAVAQDGAVWAGGYDGVSRFDGETWTTFTKLDGLAGDYVRSIALAPDGALWFGTQTGISRYLPSE